MFSQVITLKIIFCSNLLTFHYINISLAKAVHDQCLCLQWYIFLNINTLFCLQLLQAEGRSFVFGCSDRSGVLIGHHGSAQQSFQPLIVQQLQKANMDDDLLIMPFFQCIPKITPGSACIEQSWNWTLSSSESSSNRTRFFSSGSISVSFALMAKQMGAKGAAMAQRDRRSSVV